MTDASMIAERKANDAAIRAMLSVPPERMGRAKAVLVETALLLVLRERCGSSSAEADLIARLDMVLPDLRGAVDSPIWPVVQAIEALVATGQGSNRMAMLSFLRLVLTDYYTPRATASFARWRGQADASPQVVE
jgi:hypothetical protein